MLPFPMICIFSLTQSMQRDVIQISSGIARKLGPTIATCSGNVDFRVCPPPLPIAGSVTYVDKSEYTGSFVNGVPNGRGMLPLLIEPRSNLTACEHGKQPSAGPSPLPTLGLQFCRAPGLSSSVKSALCTRAARPLCMGDWQHCAVAICA